MIDRQEHKKARKNSGTSSDVLGLQAVGAGSLAGLLTFPASLGCFQIIIFSPLRISCSIPIVSSVIGSLAVAASASIASCACLSVSLLYQRFHNTTVGKDSIENGINVSYIPTDLGFYVAATIITFKLTGGRFRSVLPSSYYKAGAFARSFVPAKGYYYATTKEKLQLRKLGRIYGCHTCGNRKASDYIGDHIPPNMLRKNGQRQVFYPQCGRCSNQQGGILGANSTSLLKLKLRAHPTSLRLYHVYLPYPLILMTIRQFIL